MVAVVGVVSAAGWIIRLPVPGWMAVLLIIAVATLFLRALDLRLRRVQARRRG